MAQESYTPKSERLVTITLTFDQAEALSNGMSDLLCWTQGFKSARPEDGSTHPMGCEDVRQMRIALLKAMRDSA